MIHAIIQTFVAWALCFVFAAGFMDLSIGSVVVLAGFAAGELGNMIGYPGVVIGGLVVGVLLVFLNYFVFAFSKIPSWIAGLGLAMAYEGIGIAYSNSMVAVGKTVVLMDPAVAGMSTFPFVYILFAAGLIFTYIIYNKTTPGLYLRAIGGNGAVAKAMGINVKRTILIIGIVAGILVGIGGMINQSYAGRIFAKSGLTSLNMIFKPLATLLLAQIVQKKVNIVIAMPIAAVIVYAIFNMLTIAGVASGTLQEAILGLCVLVFGVIAQRNVKGVVK
jgi:ribose transport system permease protein